MLTKYLFFKLKFKQTFQEIDPTSSPNSLLSFLKEICRIRIALWNSF